VADRGAPGVQLAEQPRTARAIDRLPTGIVAFVGRALKGPVNHPVSVASFAEFQQLFGGLWQPATLSYAVEQFFENGGRKALIVRVANGARPPTITLPAGSTTLRLAGVNPGSRENLRASVDYDGIVESEHDRFNLVVQRVRVAGTELVEDQEIFRRLSVLPDSGRFVSDTLLESRLVRAALPIPAQRPDRSGAGAGGVTVGYTACNPDGDDGGPLTDYDVIGSATAGTGLFALQAASEFNMLCIPPLTRERDVGLSTLLVAARFCRARHAMLIVDPPSSWTCAREALDYLHTWPFRSDSAVMYFPRVQAFDRLRGRMETFGSCAAAAGLIARTDAAYPVWRAAGEDDPILRPGLRPAVAVSDPDRLRLAHAGVNTLLAVRSSLPSGVSPRTLSSGGCGVSGWQYLDARRLALFVATSIERGTRWLLLEQEGPETWERARELAEEFLGDLAADGAFAGSAPEDSHFVICDERINQPHTIASGQLNLLFGFATSKPGEFDTWLVTHQPGGGRVRPVSVNRAATCQRRVQWEIETAILRAPPH